MCPSAYAFQNSED